MLTAMDDVRLGRAFRMVRIRSGMIQAELGRRAGTSQGTISRVERGQLAGVRVATLRAIAAVLGILVDLRPRWRGGELDRLLSAGHSQLHDELARHLTDHRWLHDAEVTLSVYGERGAIDILAWHPGERIVLVIELKTELVDVQELLSSLDRKRRLARGIARERGWDPVAVAAWVVIAEDHTNRRRVAAHRHVLRAAFPADGRTVRGWLKRPAGALSALSFWRSRTGTPARRGAAPVRRVRPCADGRDEGSRSSRPAGNATRAPAPPPPPAPARSPSRSPAPTDRRAPAAPARRRDPIAAGATRAPGPGRR